MDLKQENLKFSAAKRHKKYQKLYNKGVLKNKIPKYYEHWRMEF